MSALAAAEFFAKLISFGIRVGETAVEKGVVNKADSSSLRVLLRSVAFSIEAEAAIILDEHPALAVAGVVVGLAAAAVFTPAALTLLGAAAIEGALGLAFDAAVGTAIAV